MAIAPVPPKHSHTCWALQQQDCVQGHQEAAATPASLLAGFCHTVPAIDTDPAVLHTFAHAMQQQLTPTFSRPHPQVDVVLDQLFQLLSRLPPVVGKSPHHEGNATSPQRYYSRHTGQIAYECSAAGQRGRCPVWLRDVGWLP